MTETRERIVKSVHWTFWHNWLSRVKKLNASSQIQKSMKTIIIRLELDSLHITELPDHVSEVASRKLINLRRV